MRTTIVIMICKFVTFVCHLFRFNGSAYPGYFATLFYKNVLDKIIYPEYVIAVTGSSGKGSAVALTAHILESSGKKVVWNKSGSNVRTATATLILNNTNTFSHKLEADILLLEADERYIHTLFKKGTITHLAITNITRDQPARNAHPCVVFDSITKCIDENMHLIINVDDPLLNRIKYAYSNDIITFGIDETNYDDESTPSYAVDHAYCPSCHDKLEYSSYHYGHLGIYKCPTCSFKRGTPNYNATNVDLEKGTFKIGESTLKLDKQVFFAIYYTLLAYTICDQVGIPKKEILKYINEDNHSSKRGKVYHLGKRKIEMLESKNENSLSYIQSLTYITNRPGKKSIIMGFENVSRRYKFNDLSWLWDINFELLNNKDIDKIFLIGRFKYDCATRLEYASVDPEKIVLIEDIKKLIDIVEESTKEDIYTMVCFDMTAEIKKLLKEHAE